MPIPCRHRPTARPPSPPPETLKPSNQPTHPPPHHPLPVYRPRRPSRNPPPKRAGVWCGVVRCARTLTHICTTSAQAHCTLQHPGAPLITHTQIAHNAQTHCATHTPHHPASQPPNTLLLQLLSPPPLTHTPCSSRRARVRHTTPPLLPLIPVCQRRTAAAVRLQGAAAPLLGSRPALLLPRLGRP